MVVGDSMELLRELALRPADINRVSIECESCEARMELSLSALSRVSSTPDVSNKPQQIPANCPACSDDWQAVRSAVDRFRQVLLDLEQYRVTFRVSALDQKPAVPKDVVGG